MGVVNHRQKEAALVRGLKQDRRELLEEVAQFLEAKRREMANHLLLLGMECQELSRLCLSDRAGDAVYRGQLAEAEAYLTELAEEIRTLRGKEEGGE